MFWSNLSFISLPFISFSAPLYPPNFKYLFSPLKSIESAYLLLSVFLDVGPSTRAQVAFQGHIPQTLILNPDSR